MDALVWHGRHDVRAETVEDPRIEEPTDAVIRVTSTAICGSDLHLYSKLAPALREGDVLGHEAMGVVEEVGSDVHGIRPGDRVVIPFNIACGHCFQCDRQMYSQCETTQNTATHKGASLFGYTHLYGGVPGGQAQYLRVPQAQFGPIVVPKGPPEQRFLYLSDVLPTAWQAVRYADVTEGSTVVVFGLGPVGLMCARIALHQGADRVIGVDQVPERLARARDSGVEIIDFGRVDDVVEVITEMTVGRGADCAIDAVGMEADGSIVDSLLSTVKVQPDKLHALHQALGAVRRGGTVSISGVYVGNFPMFPIGDLFDRQITLRMGQANVRRWSDEILAILEQDHDVLGVDHFASHVLPLKEGAHAYEIFQQKTDGAFKIVLEPHA